VDAGSVDPVDALDNTGREILDVLDTALGDPLEELRPQGLPDTVLEVGPGDDPPDVRDTYLPVRVSAQGMPDTLDYVGCRFA